MFAALPSSLLLTVPLAALALQNPAREGTQEAAQPQVLFELATGEVSARPLAQVDIDDLARVPAALLRFEGLPVLESPVDPEDYARIDLASGGRVHGRLEGGREELLDLRLRGQTRLRLSIEEIASLRIPSRFPASWTEPIVAADQGDRLYRTQGSGLDRIDGTLEGFSDLGVSMETPIGSKVFPWPEVAALFVEVFDEERQAPLERGAVVVDLFDGSRLPLVFQRLSPAGLDLLTPAGRGLRVPLPLVAEVLIEGRGVRFLSDVEPRRAEPSAPFGDDLGMVWPTRRDLSTSGAPLRAGGHVWTRGIGVHAPSRIEYVLDGSWTKLRGRVAIDDEVILLPARGSVQFRVSTGERLLWESPVLRGGDAPLEMPALDLSGATTLVLEVDMADELHVGDRADWLRLVLAR
jgi:hypothetical protein